MKTTSPKIYMIGVDVIHDNLQEIEIIDHTKPNKLMNMSVLEVKILRNNINVSNNYVAYITKNNNLRIIDTSTIPKEHPYELRVYITYELEVRK